jgi:hypothetical protein
MGNMSYCRFENTLADLRDCADNMDADDLSETEEKARKRLIALCKRIADDYAETD